MKKYRLSSNESKLALSYFFQSNNLDVIVENYISDVLNRLYYGDYEKNTMLLFDDYYQVIAIINKKKETCHIFSNCGINFNIKDFFGKLKLYQKYFSAIVCSEEIFEKIFEYFEEDCILIKNNKIYYSMDIQTLKHSNIIKPSRSTLHITKPIYDILSYMYISILDKKHILFIYLDYIGIIHINDAHDFIKKHYQIDKQNEEIYINERKNTYSTVNNREDAFYKEIPDDHFLNGMIVETNERTTILDLENEIQSLVVINNHMNDSYEVLYAQSKVNHILDCLKLVISTVYLNHSHFLYFKTREEIDYKSLINNGFSPYHNNIYFYYYHHNSKLINDLPELKLDVTTKLNIPLLIFKYGYYFMVIILVIIYQFISSYLNHIHYFTYSLFLFLILIPILTIKPKKIFYEGELHKNYINELKLKDIYTVLFFILIFGLGFFIIK